MTATYLLLQGWNDTDEDLQRLQTLLDPQHFLVQLSIWNPVEEMAFTPSTRLETFVTTLQHQGYETFIQRSRGQDIQGGCGQLRTRHALLQPRRVSKGREEE